MSEKNVRLFYRKSAFTALGSAEVNLPLIQAALAALTLSTPIVNSDLLAIDGGIYVEWDALPLAADDAAITAVVNAFVGAATTSAPFSVISAATSTAPNATLVTKLDLLTTPLDEGTYSVTLTSQIRLVTAATGDSVRALLTITVSGFPPITQDSSWPFALLFGYNYAIPIEVPAGRTIRVQLQFAKNGAGAALAEVSKARATVDKIG